LLAYGCAISRNWSRLCGLKDGSGKTAAVLKKDDHRGAGAKAAGGALEICDSRRHHRGSRDESRQTIDVHPIMRHRTAKGKGFAVDASVMEANASRYHGKAPDELDWTGRKDQN